CASAPIRNWGLYGLDSW
nr:immunoglobulin heavy chain junction region [Macaca mulatta]MOX02021.1 immunoglobulin heavy chain junction region [Macaca mulatta]MOX02029.1 immunoglobulin heavy chain junction region [Macaca mulatta]MOX03191.1 immunoglobulin heavy chain junction region [Macaca mulatta]MOX04256.1 immunoglobulin heavy chain junction region [Macaca mulatta]